MEIIFATFTAALTYTLSLSVLVFNHYISTQHNITWGVGIEDLYEVIRSKRVQVKRSIDNFVQVIIGPQVAAIVHSNY